MIRVKYNEINSQDRYEYRLFDNYEDFGYWFSEIYNKIIIWDIKEEG